jgi:hypothetical protein
MSGPVYSRTQCHGLLGISFGFGDSIRQITY